MGVEINHKLQIFQKSLYAVHVEFCVRIVSNRANADFALLERIQILVNVL